MKNPLEQLKFDIEYNYNTIIHTSPLYIRRVYTRPIINILKDKECLKIMKEDPITYWWIFNPYQKFLRRSNLRRFINNVVFKNVHIVQKKFINVQ